MVEKRLLTTFIPKSQAGKNAARRVRLPGYISHSPANLLTGIIQRVSRRITSPTRNYLEVCARCTGYPAFKTTS